MKQAVYHHWILFVTNTYYSLWFAAATSQPVLPPAVVVVVVTKRPVVQVSYNDLEQFATSSSATTPSGETRKHEELVNAIGHAFGPDGLGLLEVTDIPPSMVALRAKLLPMAKQLANLPATELMEITRPDTSYSIGWSHGREQFKGKYDIAKGSFYMDPFRPNSNVYPVSMQPELERCLVEMTHFMSKVGLWITKLCDCYLDQQDESHHDHRPSMQRSLFQTLESSTNAKARLLHYFPASSSSIQQAKSEMELSSFSDWCGWHTDHGSLTALLPGLCLEDTKKTGTTSSSSYTNHDATLAPGLYIQTRSNDLVHVRLSSTSLGFQIGETMSIQSHGRLQATPHAVKAGSSHLSRESLAVFLQPEPNEVLPPLTQPCVGEHHEDPNSLARRWRPTFGEFQQATIQSYK